MSALLSAKNSGPRCSKSNAERWAQIMAHCYPRGRMGKGLKEMPSAGARWAQIQKIIRQHGSVDRDGLDARLKKVRRAAKRDPLAAYVSRVAELLDVDLSEG